MNKKNINVGDLVTLGTSPVPEVLIDLYKAVREELNEVTSEDKLVGLVTEVSECSAISCILMSSEKNSVWFPNSLLEKLPIESV